MTSTTSVEASERTQLLVDEDRAPSTPEAAATTQPWEAGNRHRLKTQLAVLLFVCALYFNTYACFAPETSLREAIICKTYYDRIDHDASEMRSTERDCTVDDVQRELALVSQVYMTIAQLPGAWPPKFQEYDEASCCSLTASVRRRLQPPAID